MNLFTGIKQLWTLQGAAEKSGRSPQVQDLSLIKDAAFVVEGQKIVWVGTKVEFKKQKKKFKVKRVIDLKGAVVLPAFIDPHTHMIFAGDRKDEFELRNKGYSYQEIAAQGGGIKSTVKATRAASPNVLLQLAVEREADFIRQGVATIEIKSGYGLNFETETKILKTAKKLKRARIVSTFLGPHAVPTEFESSTDYINEVIEWLPKVRKLASRVDMFIEEGYFSKQDAEKFFAKSKDLGFEIVAHADQLHPTGASVFAATMGAVSVDHCLRLQDAEILSLGQSSTTCVLLPGSDFYLHLPYPPARRLIEAGARVALGTDYNPGTCPTQDISLIGVLARLEMKMTLPEVIVGFTLNAAHALSLSDELGSIEVGKTADFVCLNEPIESLFYQVGHHPVTSLWRSGRRLYSKKVTES